MASMRIALSIWSILAALIQVAPADAGSAGRCGGTGGSNTRTLTCPSGQYVAGIGARGGAFVDEFSIACRKIPVSGDPGDLGGFKSAGPGGGTLTNSGKCGRKDAVKAIVFNSGAFVDKVRNVNCNGREGNGWSDSISTGFVVDIGGFGGGQCIMRCPVNEALYKVTVKSGGVVDSIRGECRK
jgi:hypothetical protein